jgi:hypothetical protein
MPHSLDQYECADLVSSSNRLSIASAHMTLPAWKFNYIHRTFLFLHLLSSTLSHAPLKQAAHKISNRQHLIEEAKKAYAAKLVADKAGGPEAGELVVSVRIWWLALVEKAMTILIGLDCS